MRNALALLFVLSLNSGCEGSVKVDGCLEGWFEFICKYPKGNRENLIVETPRADLTVRMFRENEWTQTNTQLSLFDNTSGEYCRVFVKQLTRRDFDDYECKGGEEREIELKRQGNKVCPSSMQTAYRGAQTNIICKSGSNFICKENQYTCDTVSSASVHTIRDVREQDQGVYWCGNAPSDNGYRVSRQKIDLQVVTQKRLTAGQDFSHTCTYPEGHTENIFVVCKGDNSIQCHTVTSTGRFSLKDNRNWTITMTIRNVIVEDGGLYRFGAQRGNTNAFFHTLKLIVESSASTPATNPIAPTQSVHSTEFAKSSTPPKKTTDPKYFTPQPNSQDKLWVIVVVVVLCATIPLLAVAIFYLHKRFRFFANPTPATNKEEHLYEEPRACPQQPVSGTALKTIYATATLHTVKPGPNSAGNEPSTDATFKNNVLYMQR